MVYSVTMQEAYFKDKKRGGTTKPRSLASAMSQGDFGGHALKTGLANHMDQGSGGAPIHEQRRSGFGLLRETMGQ